MAPPGESYFSTEWFSNLNGTCPAGSNFKFGLDHPSGVLPERIQPMLMCIPYFFFWMVLRVICKKVLPHFAKFLGLKNRKKQEKFSYQMWLGLYYTCSTLVGAWGYNQESWFQFPLGNKGCLGIVDNWPPTPSPFMEFAYQYQLGFYLAELVAIFIEPRRSDFVEYVIHHVTTILLVSLSSLDLEMRIGCYVFFIHDIPDIFICFAKCTHYLKMEIVTNTLFAMFTVSFVFFRLICLPSSTYCLFCVGPNLDPKSSLIHQFVSVLLTFVLQALHFFWFALIIKMLVRLAAGGHGDPRSDDDDEDQVAENKKRVEDKKKKKQ